MVFSLCRCRKFPPPVEFELRVNKRHLLVFAFVFPSFLLSLVPAFPLTFFPMAKQFAPVADCFFPFADFRAAHFAWVRLNHDFFHRHHSYTVELHCHASF